VRLPLLPLLPAGSKAARSSAGSQACGSTQCLGSARRTLLQRVRQKVGHRGGRRLAEAGGRLPLLLLPHRVYTNSRLSLLCACSVSLAQS
jgi:hypothetical protein